MLTLATALCLATCSMGSSTHDNSPPSRSTKRTNSLRRRLGFVGTRKYGIPWFKRKDTNEIIEAELAGNGDPKPRKWKLSWTSRWYWPIKWKRADQPEFWVWFTTERINNNKCFDRPWKICAWIFGTLCVLS